MISPRARTLLLGFAVLGMLPAGCASPDQAAIRRLGHCQTLASAYEGFVLVADTARQPTEPEACIHRALSLEGALQRLVAVDHGASNAFRPSEDPDHRFGYYQAVLSSRHALIPRFRTWHSTCRSDHAQAVRDLDALQNELNEPLREAQRSCAALETPVALELTDRPGGAAP